MGASCRCGADRTLSERCGEINDAAAAFLAFARQLWLNQIEIWFSILRPRRSQAPLSEVHQKQLKPCFADQ
jgi:hypothetical protein